MWRTVLKKQDQILSLYKTQQLFFFYSNPVTYIILVLFILAVDTIYIPMNYIVLVSNHYTGGNLKASFNPSHILQAKYLYCLDCSKNWQGSYTSLEPK